MYLISVFGDNLKYKTCIWFLFYVENLYLNWIDTIIVVFVMYLEHVFEITNTTIVVCVMYLKHVFETTIVFETCILKLYLFIESCISIHKSVFETCICLEMGRLPHFSNQITEAGSIEGSENSRIRLFLTFPDPIG